MSTPQSPLARLFCRVLGRLRRLILQRLCADLLVLSSAKSPIRSGDYGNPLPPRVSSLFKASPAYERVVAYLLRNAANGCERLSLAAKILNDSGGEEEAGGMKILNVKRLLRPPGFRENAGEGCLYSRQDSLI